MNSYLIRSFILMAAFAVLAVFAGPSANGATQFDGAWRLIATTTSGPCGQEYDFEGEIRNGIIYPASGSTSVSGRVAPSGSAQVSLASGAIRASASGRLSSDSGNGTWNGQGPKGACSGTWTARRM